jgi:hypothetical protein
MHDPAHQRPGDRSTRESVPLVARLHVDLMRVSTAACRP